MSGFRNPDKINHKAFIINKIILIYNAMIVTKIIDSIDC